jgi:cytochrome bd-type quinol oxidase subunit 2
VPELFYWVVAFVIGACLQAAFTASIEKHSSWKFWDAFRVVLIGSILSMSAMIVMLTAVWVGMPQVLKPSESNLGVWQLHATTILLVGVALAYYIGVIRRISRPPIDS